MVQRHTQLCRSWSRRHLSRDLNMISQSPSASCFKAVVQGPCNGVPRPQSFLPKLLLFPMVVKGNKQATVLILNKKRTLQRTTDTLSPISTACLLSWQVKRVQSLGAVFCVCNYFYLLKTIFLPFFLLNNIHAIIRLNSNHLHFLWGLVSCIGNNLLGLNWTELSRTPFVQATAYQSLCTYKVTCFKIFYSQ